MMVGGDGDQVPSYGYGWAGLWSTVASFLFLWSMVQDHLPFQLQDHLAALARRVLAAADSFARSDAYRAAEAYLSATCADRASRLRAELPDGADRVSLAVDDHVEVVDVFRGARLWWRKTRTLRRSNVVAWSPREEERRAYRLTFHRRHRGLVEAAYLPHVLAEGRAATVRNRQRRLYTNNASGGEWAGAEDGPRVWSHVKLDHPSTFATLAMDPAHKEAIVDDLDMFRDGKDYYASVGKAWKRGYLLFGPPGTGKSTMIAAMANYLDYDVYNLELSAVKSNTELRRLFIETTGKSIVVIEDIDCSVDLTGKRKEKKKKNKKKKMPWENEEDKDGKVTLSGLLNFIDGLWSACGGERIIVFTTNHKDKLDPALIRRGRMDKHIEMPYCRFEAFKVLAGNYLGVADHELFGEIRRLLEQVDMTAADVAENLMPRSKKKDVDACLAKLVKALKEAPLLAESLALNKGENKGEEGTDEDDDNGCTTASSDLDSDEEENKMEEDRTKKKHE